MYVIKVYLFLKYNIRQRNIPPASCRRQMDDKIDTEVIVMKRLLKLAAVDALQSLFPVLL